MERGGTKIQPQENKEIKDIKYIVPRRPKNKDINNQIIPQLL